MQGSPGAAESDPLGRDRLRVAVDATPLLGTERASGCSARALSGPSATHRDLDVAAFAVTWRRRRRWRPLVPAGVRVVPAGHAGPPAALAWARRSGPPLEWFVGPADVVHGTNFVVPPTRRAARVVTVHDLTTVHFPSLCDASTLGFPAIVRRAIAEGAWVHTPSQFVADEVVAEFGADPERVRVVYHGVPGHDPVPAAPSDRPPPPVRLSLPEKTDALRPGARDRRAAQGLPRTGACLRPSRRRTMPTSRW